MLEWERQREERVKKYRDVCMYSRAYGRIKDILFNDKGEVRKREIFINVHFLELEKYTDISPALLCICR